MITYTVFRYGPAPGRKPRPYYVVRWKHGPPGSRQGERSTKQKSKRKAEEWAARFIASLAAGCDPAGGAVTWRAFRDAYKERRLSKLSSHASYTSALNAAEACLQPRLLVDVDSEAFERFASWLKKRGHPRSTVASYAKHLRAALGWAEQERLLIRAPAVRTGQTDDMRGRPLTVEEFELLTATTEKLLGKRAAADLNRVLIGAWSIGLRRGEFFRVWWDRDDKIRPLGLNAGTPRISFPADQHKARRDMLLPLLPDAAEMLRRTPPSKRTGPVFGGLRGKRKAINTPDGLGKMVAAIGQAARIVTRVDDEGGKHTATLHDLRRSLGTRLAHAPGLSVPEVAMMMRHTKIETTMAHYAELNVGKLGEKLGSLEGCTLSCTDDSKPSVAEREISYG